MSSSLFTKAVYHHAQDQRQLAAANPNNPLLQVRGNAGTHDIELGRATLTALTSATASNSEVPSAYIDLLATQDITMSTLR